LRFEVDTSQRTCTYLGADGDRYVEPYPQVTLAMPDVFASCA
jgi:uncharacterized protein YbcV (DUF1398 family)